MIETHRPLPSLPVLLALLALLASCSSDEAPTVATTAPPPEATDPGPAGPTSTEPGPGPSAPDGTVASEVDFDSLTVAADGMWSARGLVSNPGDADETVAVTASLLDGSGAIVATVTGEALVEPVRGGESAPFVVESQVPVPDVAQVLWDVVAVPADAGVSRDFDVVTYWERGVDDERVVDMYLYTDPPDGDRAYLLFGSVENVGGSAVNEVDVVVAWLDGGRVVWTQTVPAELGDRPSLEPGGAADWLVVSAPDATPVPLAGLETRFWGIGS